MAVSNHSSSNKAHSRLSKLIGACAIVPPRAAHDINLFDIVTVRPKGPRTEMLQCTDSNLCQVLPEEKKQALREKVRFHGPSSDEKHLTSDLVWSKAGISTLEALFGAATLRIGTNGRRNVDIVANDVQKWDLEQGSSKNVEQYVYEYFPQIVLKTPFGRDIRERFIIGIVTGITTGKLAYITEVSRSIDTAIGIGGEAVAANQGGQYTYAERTHVLGSGVIGVNMVCFVAKYEADTRVYNLSKSILMVHSDEDMFKSARSFLRSGRGPSRILAISRRNNHLFAAGHMTRGDNLTEEELLEYNRFTAERSRVNSVLAPSESMVCGQNCGGSKLMLAESFGGIAGRDLWNADGPSLRREDNRLNQYLIAADVEGLEEARTEEHLPWMASCKADRS